MHGLPGRLPEGERLLWQGSPDRRLFARHVMQGRKLACYFGVLILAVAITSIYDGEGPGAVGLDVLKAAGAACVPLLLIEVYAWAVARGTVYTITDKRVVLRIGIALPVTINVPFARLANADMARRSGAGGDIALTLCGTDKIAYFVLWPHVRPWRFSRPQPMLRSLPDVQAAAQALARALAASAGQPAPALPRADAAVTAPQVATA